MRRHRQIALLGSPGVGKSSLAHHFVYKQFHNVYDPNIKTTLEHQYIFNEEQYSLKIVDNAGFDQYTLNHHDFDNSDSYILVYAVDDRQSFEMVSKIRDRILSTSTLTRIPMVLVGNKIDRRDERLVSTDDGRKLANQWKVHFVEASALDLDTVQKIFERSVYAMDNVEINELDQETQTNRSSNNEKNPHPSPKKNGLNKRKSNDVSTKDASHKTSCLLS